MDTLQCAIVLAKLARFDWEVERRSFLGGLYNDAMDRIGMPRIVQKAARTSVFAQYTVLCDDRLSMQASLESAGVPTAIHYPSPMNRQEPYRGYCCGDCTPVADEMAGKVLSLPMSADLDPAVVPTVAGLLARARSAVPGNMSGNA